MLSFDSHRLKVYGCWYDTLRNNFRISPGGEAPAEPENLRLEPASRDLYLLIACPENLPANACRSGNMQNLPMNQLDPA